MSLLKKEARGAVLALPEDDNDDDVENDDDDDGDDDDDDDDIAAVADDDDDTEPMCVPLLLQLMLERALGASAPSFLGVLENKAISSKTLAVDMYQHSK